MLVVRSKADTPNLARAPRREARAFPSVTGAETHSDQTWSKRGSASSRIAGLLAVFFLVASVIALYEVAQAPRAFTNNARTFDSVQTIRTFYAGLDEFMETGDASAVLSTLAPGALAFVPEEGAMGADSDLLTYLLALRSTYPQLRFTVEEIDAGGDIAIASVRRSGTPDASALGAPETVGISQEFFRVQDGRIVRHWTTAPSFVLLHPLIVSPIPIAAYQPGHLAIAELIFAPGKDDLEPIEGPALVIVQRGHLALAGNGFSQIVDLATGATSVPGSLERGRAGPGQAIAILDGSASVWNDDSRTATALIATFVKAPPPIMEHLSIDPHPPPPPINDMSLLGMKRVTVSGAVTVRPLAFDRREIPNGRWELETAWVVLGPGDTLPLSTDGEWGIAQVISDSQRAVIAKQQSPELPDTLTNDGPTPIVALVMRLHITR